MSRLVAQSDSTWQVKTEFPSEQRAGRSSLRRTARPRASYQICNPFEKPESFGPETHTHEWIAVFHFAKRWYGNAKAGGEAFLRRVSDKAAFSKTQAGSGEFFFGININQGIS